MSGTTPPKGHILLIDDATNLLTALEEFLSDQGYSVETADVPQMALELLEEKVFDLVVTDIRMPGITGMELLGRLKTTNPQIEVIMITGYGSKDSVLEALRLGAYDFIEKPFDTIELLKSIVNCMESIRLRTRIDGLVEDLHEQRWELARSVEKQSEQLEEKEQCIQHMESISRTIENIAADIDRSNRTISKDLEVCRNRRQSYYADVSRLVTTGTRETRRMRSHISNLEAVASEIADGLRDKPERRIERRAPVPDAVEPEPEIAAPPNDQPARDLAAEQAVDDIYAEMEQFVANLIADAASGAAAQIEPATGLMERILGQKNAVEMLYRRAIYSFSKDDTGDLTSAVVTHSANASIYALKLGQGLNCDAEHLAHLGIAGLVHDVGMAFLPPELYTKDSLDAGDLELLRGHPRKGHDYLMDLGEIWRDLAIIALQEHEREDGTGYPEGLKGDQILDEARVIGIVDTYAGLTRTHPGRRGLLPYDAVREITQTHRRKFHRKILRVLLHELSAFPVGSVVRLNSGTVARVIETDASYPLRPVVQPISGSEGQTLPDNRRLPLAENPILHISGVVYEREA